MTPIYSKRGTDQNGLNGHVNSRTPCVLTRVAGLSDDSQSKHAHATYRGHLKVEITQQQRDFPCSRSVML